VTAFAHMKAAYIVLMHNFLKLLSYFLLTSAAVDLNN